MSSVPKATTWVCPHCNFAQVFTKDKIDGADIHVDIAGLHEGTVALRYKAFGCSNPNCKKLTLSCYLYPAGRTLTNGPDLIYAKGNALAGMRFLPKGASKPQPSYIPQPLVIDYEEACAIKDLSPKAAATLVRRCLQGMIRDFAGIAKPTLAKEIEALRDAVMGGSGPKGVDIETIEALNHVRSIGNIGAHFEKDINIIFDVDPEEAQMLIELVEMLFDEWYVARERRAASLSAIKALSEKKQEDRKQPPMLAAPSEFAGDMPVPEGIAIANTKS